MSRAPIALVAAGMFALPRLGTAQVVVQSKAVEISLTGRVHTQFNTTSVASSRASEFLIRRARFTADVDISDVISGKVQPDFGEGEINLKDAYLRLALDPAVRVTVGQFKRPFDLFELVSSVRILVVERAGGIRGVDQCGGVGGVCTFSRFTEALGFSDRDIGVLIDGDASRQLSYQVAVTNGSGANAEDENGTKSYTARFTFTPFEGLTVATNLGAHDYLNAVTNSDEYALAVGADVEVGSWEGGGHLQAGVAAGENWRNLDPSGDASDFVAAQMIASYQHPVDGHPVVRAVEPLARISWGDPGADDDGGWLLTPGVMVHFAGFNKIAANVDVWAPSTGGAEWSLKVQSYLHF